MEYEYKIKAYERNQIELYSVWGDTDSRTVIFDIVEKSGVIAAVSNAQVTDLMLDLTGYTAKLRVSGSTVQTAGTITDAQNGKVQFTLTEDFCKPAGEYQCEIILTKNSEKLYVIGIKLKVDYPVSAGKTVMDENANAAYISKFVSDWMSENINSAGNVVIDNSLSVSGAAADAQKTGIALAADYDSTKTYTIGSIVMHNGGIYQCKVNMSSAAGTWDSSKWYGTHLSSLIQRAAHYVPDNIVEIVSSSNYQSLGISSVYDLPPNTNIRINSDITEAMIPGLPLYGKFGTITSISFETIDRQSLLIYCSGTSRKEKIWYSLIRVNDNTSDPVYVNWIPLLSERSYNEKIVSGNPSVLAPVVDAESVHWNRFTFIPASGGESESIRAASTDFIPVQSGSVIKYTGEVTNTGYTGRTRACAVAYYEDDDNADFIVRHSLISTATVNGSNIISRDISVVPKDAKYMRVTYSYLSGLSPSLTFESLSDYRAAMQGFSLEVTPPVVRPHVPSQIFNINLSAANEYSDLSNYSSSNIDSYGYTNAAGWENRVTIDKSVVCDDVSYSAVIKLEDASSVCALGTEKKYTGSSHSTIVKFDFANSQIILLGNAAPPNHTGGYDGKTLSNLVEYETITMNNVSGTAYRLEIGRRKRCPYVKVYNMTTGQICADYIDTDYATNLGYGGKWGTLYDVPNFGTISGSVTFRRVSAAVPTDVFAMFVGDSITQGSKVAHDEAWANRAIEYLGGHSLNCGRGGGKLNDALKIINDIAPAARPKYIIVTIGTNQPDATREEYEQIRDAIIENGAIPIINCISMLKNKYTTMDLNNVILSLGADSCRFDRATADGNNTSNGRDTELFKFGTEYDDTHPNTAGHEEMYNCFIATVGYIADEILLSQTSVVSGGYQISSTATNNLTLNGGD